MQSRTANSPFASATARRDLQARTHLEADAYHLAVKSKDSKYPIAKIASLTYIIAIPTLSSVKGLAPEGAGTIARFRCRAHTIEL